MVFNVRCFKCGEREVRLVLGGRSIIHARCHGCDSNLLAEVMALEQEVEEQQTSQTFESNTENSRGDRPPTQSMSAISVESAG